MRYTFVRRPSTLATMLRALSPSPGVGTSAAHTRLAARWQGHRPSPLHVAHVRAMLGQPADGLLPMVYPWVVTFPLQMSLLTRPVFPLNISRVLQTRYRLLQHRAPPEGATLDMAMRFASQRVLERGVEFDFFGSVQADGELAWESLNTFYARGHFGEAEAAAPNSQAPEFPQDSLSAWNMPAGGGWRFAGLTGDYNPLHWAPRLARRRGYRGAFHHPQLVVGQCLTHLPQSGVGRPVRLDVWLKGPVYYGLPVQLRGGGEESELRFGLFCDDELRPALVGRLSPAAPGGTLFGEAAGSE